VVKRGCDRILACGRVPRRRGPHDGRIRHLEAMYCTGPGCLSGSALEFFRMHLAAPRVRDPTGRSSERCRWLDEVGGGPVPSAAGNLLTHVMPIQTKAEIPAQRSLV